MGDEKISPWLMLPFGGFPNVEWGTKPFSFWKICPQKFHSSHPTQSCFRFHSYYSNLELLLFQPFNRRKKRLHEQGADNSISGGKKWKKTCQWDRGIRGECCLGWGLGRQGAASTDGDAVIRRFVDDHLGRGRWIFHFDLDRFRNTQKKGLCHLDLYGFLRSLHSWPSRIDPKWPKVELEVETAVDPVDDNGPPDNGPSISEVDAAYFEVGPGPSPVYTQLMEMPPKILGGIKKIDAKIRKVILKGFPRTLVHCLGCCRIMTSGLQMQFFPYYSIPFPLFQWPPKVLLLHPYFWMKNMWACTMNESPNIPKLISIPIDDYGYLTPTLPETNIFAPENGWLEYYLPIGMAYFQVLNIC